LIPNKLPRQPKKWLFKVVVRLGRNVVVLKVLLAVEGNVLSFDFALLYVDLVSAQNNGDVVTNSGEVTYATVNMIVRIGLEYPRCQFGTFL
jgi:hypothetical protein